jgi:hypothetical protein
MVINDSISALSMSVNLLHMVVVHVLMCPHRLLLFQCLLHHLLVMRCLCWSFILIIFIIGIRTKSLHMLWAP